MKLRDILIEIDGREAYPDEENLDRDYSYAFATDMMSNVMLGNVEDSILITSLVNPQVIRASEMMGISAIVLTSGMHATDNMIQLAQIREISLAETELPTFTVCGRLHNLGITAGPTADEHKIINSIALVDERCKGCAHCVRVCPTEAIRIRKWKAHVDPERCIECGMCIKICPYHAMRPLADSIESLEEFDYRIAVPSSAFFGQFNNVKSRNHLLTALKQIGFDEVYEEAIGNEIISHAVKEKLEAGEFDGTVISAGCPSVIKLIQMKFPELIDHVLDFKHPAEVVAEKAKAHARELYPDKSIGVFFIAPCTSEISSCKEGQLESGDSMVDKMIPINSVYRQVLANLKTLKDEDVEHLAKAGVNGLRWTTSGGECLALGTDKFIAVDGIEEIIDIFDQLEKGTLQDVDFIEADACKGACLGGSLTVQNQFSAKATMKKIVDESKRLQGYGFMYDSSSEDVILRNNELKYNPVLQLDDNLKVALRKMEEINKIVRKLPGIDCGVCGAPTCKAFAEDIVRGAVFDRKCPISRYVEKSK